MLPPQNKWSNWYRFPGNGSELYLIAPFGPGVYELRNQANNKLVYCGASKNVASRMSSLLPKPIGTGRRNNMLLRQYVDENLKDIEYRTKASVCRKTAKKEERNMHNNYKYLFV